MDARQTALSLLPRELREGLGSEEREAIEELRLRVGRPIGVIGPAGERESRTRPVSEEDILTVLERATDASLHTAIQALCEGCYSKNGLRIGVCGDAIIQNGRCLGFRRFSSAALRIPRECRGILDSLRGELLDGGFESCLLIAPPGGGKTTALRELIRLLADSGVRVGVADERAELSLGSGLGRCCDLVTGLSKPEAAMMLLRGMNPQVLAVDEISRAEDCRAMEELFGCGVKLLASAHAESRDDLLRRPVYRSLLEQRLFRRLLVIERTGAGRRYRLESLP